MCSEIIKGFPYWDTYWHNKLYVFNAFAFVLIHPLTVGRVGASVVYLEKSMKVLNLHIKVPEPPFGET